MKAASTNIVLKKDIVNSSIPRHDHRAFIRFFNNLNLQNVGYRRQRKLLTQILNCYDIDIFDSAAPILTWGEDEVQNAVAAISAMDTYTREWAGKTVIKKYTENTRIDYRRLIRQLLNFFSTIDDRFDSDCKKKRKDAREMYAAKDRIKTGAQMKKVHPSELITLDDFKKIMKIVKSKRNRCLYAILFFTGWRIGGIINIRLKDIIRKEKSWLIRIDDKTGIDSLPVYHCVPFIRQYLDKSHPTPDDPNSYLFPGKHEGPITQVTLNQLEYRTEQSLKRRFGVDKNLTPYMFRRSRATRDCTRYNPETFKRLMKWSPRSNAIQHYLHFNSQDIEKQYAKVNKIDVSDTDDGVEWVCTSCTFVNAVYNDYCDKCNLPKVKTLKEHEVIEKEEQIRLRSEFMAHLLENPKMLEVFQQWKETTRS